MQFKSTVVQALAAASVAGLVSAEDANPSSWTSLKPTATYAGATSDYSSSFGIAIEPITTGSLAPSSTGSAAKPTTTASKAKRDAVSQIGDGQVQGTTKPATKPATKSATATKPTESGAVSQISDGQIQGTTKTLQPKASGASQISDGQIQASGKPKADDDAKKNGDDGDSGITLSACSNNGTLTMTLKGGLLFDAKGRVGSIVSNHQFQFDGPPPQAGSIYANGWSITKDGNLALGDSDVFYKCLSGDFYNLYDAHIANQCSPVHLNIVSLVQC